MGSDDLFYSDTNNNILNGLDSSSDAYRIFSLKYFLLALNKKKLTLVNMHKYWEDPYENYLYSMPLMYSGTPVDTTNIKSTAFGQSWSLLPESDALWRIYSDISYCAGSYPKKCGIKVRVKVSNLLNQLWGDGRRARISLYLGNVNYVSETGFISFFQDKDKVRHAYIEDDTHRGTADFALLKRLPFEHEKEIRILYFTETHAPETTSGLAHFPIDPNSLFEEAVLDPRLSDDHSNFIRKLIVAAGYTGHIYKSTLYSLSGAQTPVDLH